MDIKLSFRGPKLAARWNSRMLKLLILAGLFIGVASGCGTPRLAWERRLLERIPITVQKDKPTLFQVRVRAKTNELRLQCAPELWQTLTNGGVDQITIQLVSSSKTGAKLYAMHPGSPLGRFTNSPDIQFLCQILGERKGTATVQITFPDGPDGPSPAAIIVTKYPDKTRALLGYW